MTGVDVVDVDHCPACRVASELRKHRDETAPMWSERRAAFSFAIVLARWACPAYVFLGAGLVEEDAALAASVSGEVPFDG